MAAGLGSAAKRFNGTYQKKVWMYAFQIGSIEHVAARLRALWCWAWRDVTKHWTEEIRIEFCKFIVYLLSVWVRFGIHLHKRIEHTECGAHTRPRIPSGRVERCADTRIHSMGPTRSLYDTVGEFRYSELSKNENNNRKKKSGRRKKRLIRPSTVCFGTCDECLGFHMMCVCVKRVRHRNRFKSCDSLSMWYTFSNGEQ